MMGRERVWERVSRECMAREQEDRKLGPEGGRTGGRPLLRPANPNPRCRAAAAPEVPDLAMVPRLRISSSRVMPTPRSRSVSTRFSLSSDI